MSALLAVLLLAAPSGGLVCGTPERLDQFRAGILAHRPAVGQCRTGSGSCWVHYDTTGRHATTHAYAESASSYVARAWWRQVDTLGWAAPAPDQQGPDSRLDVYLVDTSAWDGLTSPEDQYDEPYPDGWTCFIQIRTGLNWSGLRLVIAHEFNHACQARYSGVEITSFYENTAEWMSDWTMEGWGFGAWWLNGFRHPLDSTHFRLSRFTYPGWLWPRFLHEYYADPVCPRRVWEQLGAQGGENTWWGTWVALYNYYSSTMERALGHYAIWRWFTGSRDDSRHFQDAEDWQTSRCYHWYAQYPVIDSATDRLPEAPGGCKFVGFTGFGQNRVRIFFDGEDGRTWDVYVLGLGSIPREYRILLPNSLDTGSIVIPGWQYDTIVLVAVATQLVETGGWRFAWRATIEGDSTGVVESAPLAADVVLAVRSAPGGAWLRWQLPAGADGSLLISDALGRNVRRLAVRGTGQECWTWWDGTDDGRRRVPAGSYFCRLGGTAACSKSFALIGQ